MKFEIDVKGVLLGKTHTETYVKNIDDPEAWAKEQIENFNRTIKPGEDIRKLVAVRVLDPDAKEPEPSPHINEHVEEDYDDWEEEDWDEDEDDEDFDDPWAPDYPLDEDEDEDP